MNSTHHITKLLHDWNDGDAEALNRLIPLADSELKKIARREMSKERQGHSFQPTDLVEEAWLKLFREKKPVVWVNRRHFYSLLTWRMRQVLCDYARQHEKVQYTGLTGKVLSQKQSREIVKLHDALDTLAQINQRAARVVELRYFGGHTVEKVAEILDVSEATVTREWRFAKDWLWDALTSNAN